MSETEVDLTKVDEFLAAERKKLDKDRKIIDLILTLLNNKQQIFSNSSNNESAQTESSNHDAEKQIVDSKNNEDRVTCPKSTKLYKTYNSQVEKERLAYLFENAPHFLNLRCSTPKKFRHIRTYNFYSANKENQNPICSHRLNSKTSSSNCETDRKETDDVENMVRISEFSPLRSSSNSFDRPLMGLGEYEGRRRAFLEKKKREYMEYLSNMKANRKLQKLRSEKKSLETNKDDGYASHSSENSPSREKSHLHKKLFSTDGNLIEDVDLNHCYTRIQQENYRKELDEQIREKEILEKKRKDSEERECQINQFKDVQQRRDVMTRIEDDFNRRLKVLNDCKHESDKIRGNKTGFSRHDKNSVSNSTREQQSKVHSTLIAQQNDPFVKPNIETCSIEDPNVYDKMKKELYKRELTKQIEEKQQLEEERKNSAKRRELCSRNEQTSSRVPHYLGNPFMKQSAESCAIDDLEEYRRMKDEIYKRELDKQIEEKRKLEAERKAKAEEAERKLEEKLKKDAERRLAEVSMDEAFQINQRVEESIRLSPKCPNNQTDIALRKYQSNSFKKGSDVTSTDHKSKDKMMGKNVSFAPRAYVYDHRENSPLVCVDRKMSKDGSVIIEAPYVLAVKNISNVNNINNDNDRKKPVSPKSPDRLPIPTDVRQSLPEIANLPIPSAVSMSEQAVRDYFKTGAFSDLSQIRKMLRERQSKLN